jgi:hypothetical protein
MVLSVSFPLCLIKKIKCDTRVILPFVEIFFCYFRYINLEIKKSKKFEKIGKLIFKNKKNSKKLEN